MRIGNVVLSQALRELGLSYSKIAGKLGIAKSTAYWHVNYTLTEGCLSWEERSDFQRHEAMIQAKYIALDEI